MLKTFRRPLVKEYIFQRFLQHNIALGFSYNNNNKLNNLVKNVNIIETNQFNIVYTQSDNTVVQSALSYAKATNNTGIVLCNGRIDFIKPIINITHPLIFVNFFYDYSNDYSNDYSKFSNIITINTVSGVKPAINYLLNIAINNNNTNKFLLSVNHSILDNKMNEFMDMNINMLDDESELQFLERKYKIIEEYEYNN